MAERVQVDLAELREDHRVLKFAGRRIARPRESDGASMLDRERPPSAESAPSGLAFLIAATAMEASGDAIVRIGLFQPSWLVRLALFVVWRIEPSEGDAQKGAG